MSRYEAYVEGCKRFKVKNPYANEEEYSRAYGICNEVEVPVYVARKAVTQKTVSPSLEMHEKIKKSKPAKAIKTKPRTVIPREEDRKLNRTKWMREKREEWKAAGLTSNGTPFKVKGEKPDLTTLEIRAKRCKYAKTYRTNHRDAHLQYRRDYRAKQSKRDHALIESSQTQ